MTQYYFNGSYRPARTVERAAGIVAIAILAWIVMPIAIVIAAMRHEQYPGSRSSGSGRHGR